MITGRVLASFLPLALAGFLLMACTPRAGAPSESAGESAAPKRGGVLRVTGSGDPAHLDPVDTIAANLHSTGPGIAYSRLLRYEHTPTTPDVSFIPVPDLAERWEQTTPTTFLFHLRKGIKFHNIPSVNGRELVAGDVVYSYNRQRQPGKPNAGQLRSVEAVEAPDGYTVKITLKEPDADFLVDLADGHNKVFAREAVELRGDLKNGPTIGTGPFILENYEKGVGSFFVRNPNYFEPELPYPDRLEVYTGFADKTSRIAAFRTGRIDLVDVAPEERDAIVRDHPQIKEARIRRSTSQFLSIKVDRPPFNNLKVRQAISKAIDRYQINETAWSGLGWFHAGIATAGQFLLPESDLRRYYQRDLEGAKRLLAEAGYPSGFEMEVVVGALWPEDMPTAELFAAQLKEANITARLQPMEYARYQQQILAKSEFTAAAYGNYSTLPTVNTSLTGLLKSGSVRNHNSVNDQALERMIAEQAGEMDNEKRKRQLHAIQRYILDNVYLMLVHTREDLTLMWPYIRDWMPGKGYDGIYHAYAWLDK